MDAYIGLLHPPEGGSEWGVTFPDLPGCVSAGASFEAAVAAGSEALSGHLALMISEGDPLPKVRTLNDLRTDPAASGDLDGALVQIIAPSPAVGERGSIDIAIDADLLRLADAAAHARGLSRSAFIEAALTTAAHD